jgi:hypothetical protein
MSNQKEQTYSNTTPLPTRTINTEKSGVKDNVFFPTDNSKVSWNQMIEQNVLEIGEKSKGYKIMHTKQSRKTSKKYDLLMYAGIVLGPLSGLLSGIDAIRADPEESVIFSVAAACVGFISGIVVAITKYGKFEKKSYDHKVAASKYTSLESNVRRQLALCRSDRVNAVYYLEWVGDSFDDLFLVSPLVASKIYEDYVKIARANGIIIPDEYKITINVSEDEYNRNKDEMKDVTKIEINTPEMENRRYIGKRQSASSSDNLTNVKIEIQRSDNVQELNKFSDGKMIYEMQRMLGRET